MSEGVALLVYPVKERGRGEEAVHHAAGTEPYADMPYYVGYRVGDQEIGLDPNSQSQGPIAYWETDDIKARLAELVDAGAEVAQSPKERRRRSARRPGKGRERQHHRVPPGPLTATASGAGRTTRSAPGTGSTRSRRIPRRTSWRRGRT